MPLIKCKDKRNTCGVPFPSTCVGYEGAFAGVLDEDDFDCNVNLDDVIERLSLIIKDLNDARVASINQHTTSINNIISDIADIQETLSNLDASTLFVTMDLGCLSDAASPCEVSPQRYTIKTILQLFRDEICLLKV